MYKYIHLYSFIWQPFICTCCYNNNIDDDNNNDNKIDDDQHSMLKRILSNACDEDISLSLSSSMHTK